MKKVSILGAALVLAGGLTLAYAADADRGKALFASPDLGGGTTGRSCASCHDGGSGLGGDLFEGRQYPIEAIINTCIERAMGGKAIDPQGQEMQSLVAYLKTLVSGNSGKKRKKIEGC